MTIRRRVRRWSRRGRRRRSRRSVRRWLMVCSRRSPLTEVAMTGPSHSRRAGMANPVVFPVPAGPMTATECWASVAMSLRWTVPRVRRPGWGRRIRRGLRSRGLAHRADSPSEELLMAVVPAVADRTDGNQNRHEEDEGGVVGERAGKQVAGCRWPCLDRLSRVGDEFPEDEGALREGNGQPGAGPEAGGDLAGGPHHQAGCHQAAGDDGEDLLTVRAVRCRVGHRSMPRCRAVRCRLCGSVMRVRRSGAWQAPQRQARGVGWVHPSGQ